MRVVYRSSDTPLKILLDEKERKIMQQISNEHKTTRKHNLDLHKATRKQHLDLHEKTIKQVADENKANMQANVDQHRLTRTASKRSEKVVVNEVNVAVNAARSEILESAKKDKEQVMQCVHQLMDQLKANQQCPASPMVGSLASRSHSPANETKEQKWARKLQVSNMCCSILARSRFLTLLTHYIRNTDKPRKMRRMHSTTQEGALKIANVNLRWPKQN